MQYFLQAEEVISDPILEMQCKHYIFIFQQQHCFTTFLLSKTTKAGEENIALVPQQL